MWVIGVVIFVVLLLIVMTRKKASAEPKTAMAPSTPPVSSSAPAIDEHKVLKYGMKDSAEVRMLQRYINNTDTYNLTVDGDFGPKTREALVALTGLAEITLYEFRSMPLNYSSSM